MKHRNVLAAAVAALLLSALAGCAAPAKPAKELPVWKLTPLHTGLCQLGEDHVLGDEYSGEKRLPFMLYTFVAEGPNGEVVLIDMGPVSLGFVNDMFRRYKFFRPGKGDDIVQPLGNAFEQLEKMNIPKEKITHFVNTHLHCDHHGVDDAKNGGGLELLPNVRFCISKKGWEVNLKTRKDGQFHSYLDRAFGELVLEREKQGRVDFIDEGEYLPGIEVRFLGGHSPCGRAVLVHTADGWGVITSDEVYHYKLLEKGILARLRTSANNLLEATDRLVAIATGKDPRIRKDNSAAWPPVLLPVHDPTIWETQQKAGDGWLGALRPLSEKAAQGFLSNRDKIKMVGKKKEKGPH